MAKKALITGVTGQDGSYLAELLVSKGYEVTGVVRRLSAPNAWRIQQVRDKITLVQADLLDQLSLIKAVEASEPDEFYNLAAMSFVPSSWDQSEKPIACNAKCKMQNAKLRACAQIWQFCLAF